jgi:hypothetical protein
MPLVTGEILASHQPLLGSLGNPRFLSNRHYDASNTSTYTITIGIWFKLGISLSSQFKDFNDLG